MHFIYERQRISVVKNPIKGESSVLTDERCAGNTGCRFTDDKLLFPAARRLSVCAGEKGERVVCPVDDKQENGKGGSHGLTKSVLPYRHRRRVGGMPNERKQPFERSEL